jgi:hypothetical protein
MLATPDYLFTIPGAALSVLGILTLSLALVGNGINLGLERWQPVFAGGIFLAVGVNAVLLGFASRLYTTSRAITKEDWLLRMYRRYLSLELLVALGVLLVVAGIGVDVALIFAGAEGVNRLDLAAVGQSLILLGANVVLVSCLTSLLEQN